MYYVPLWLLIICLPVSALALYLGLRETNLSRPLVYGLSALLSPIFLVAVTLAAVTASTALSTATEEPVETGGPPREERPEPSGSGEPATPEPTTPAQTPGASTSASASASASAPASASASPAAE